MLRLLFSTDCHFKHLIFVDDLPLLKFNFNSTVFEFIIASNICSESG